MSSGYRVDIGKNALLACKLTLALLAQHCHVKTTRSKQTDLRFAVIHVGINSRYLTAML